MSRSKIGSTLNKKRKITLLKKVFFIFIVMLFLFSLFILSLTNKKIRIKENIKIIGNSSVSSEDILKIVNRELDQKYLFLIPTDNFFFLRRNKIKESIYNDFKKIKKINIDLDGFTFLNLDIKERISDGLWCDGTPERYKNCYFMDDEGFVFAMAPNFTNNIFIKYYGFILKDNPIGENYFYPDRFEKIKIFMSEIKKLGFNPKFFVVIDEHQYEIILSEDVKIVFDDKEDLLKNILKLSVLLENNYIKTDIDFISKINHIDLRYGNKVHYDFK